jgi:signal transduction histidine kinase
MLLLRGHAGTGREDMRMQGPAARDHTPVAAALDALASDMGLGLLLVGPDGTPVFASQSALGLLDCAGTDDLGRRWPALRDAMRPCAGAGEVQAFVAELVLDGGLRSLRGEIRDADGVRQVFLKDRRRLGALDGELLCASRMKEWVHQCEGVVHDANGALNTIQLTLELLDGQWPGPRAGEQAQEPHRRNHVGVIRDNLGKLKATLRRLVDAHDAPPPAVFDLRETVQEAASTLRMPARRRRVELQVSIPETPVRARASHAHLRQALVNVALARLASVPERSRLVLEAVSAPGGATLACRDEGLLADPERAGIFRLMLGPPSADGLRLARALVESEGGEFEVDAGPAAGAVFRFVFPVA